MNTTVIQPGGAGVASEALRSPARHRAPAVASSVSAGITIFGSELGIASARIRRPVRRDGAVGRGIRTRVDGDRRGARVGHQSAARPSLPGILVRTARTSAARESIDVRRCRAPDGAGRAAGSVNARAWAVATRADLVIRGAHGDDAGHHCPLVSRCLRRALVLSTMRGHVWSRVLPGAGLSAHHGR